MPRASTYAGACPGLGCMWLELIALCCMDVLKGHPTAQATVTTTRTSDETFRVEMSGAVGSKVLAFDVAVALHA